MLRVAVTPGLAHCYVSLPLAVNIPIGPVVVTGPRSRHFLGFLGGRCDDSRLALSPEVAQLLDYADGDAVTVAPVTLPAIAKLEVDPVDSDSWELIESNSDYFESAILQQISVIEQGMTVPLWLHNAQSVRVKVSDFGFPAGVIGNWTEISVKAKERPQRRLGKRQLRGVVGDQPWLETCCGEVNQVVLLESGDRVGLGVIKRNDFPEGHIKSPFFSDFVQVVMEEIRLPGFNQPFTMQKKTKSMQLSPAAEVTIYCSLESDKGRFLDYIERETGSVILQSGMKVMVEGRWFEVGMECREEEIVGVYVDANLPGFDTLKSQLHFVPFPTPQPLPLYTTSKTQSILSTLISSIKPYYAHSLPSSAITIWGPKGVGKTSLISLLRSRLKQDLIATCVLACTELLTNDDKYLAEMDSFVLKSAEMAPVVVVFDDIDAIVRKVDINSAEGSAVDSLKHEKAAQRLISYIEAEKRRVNPMVKFVFVCEDIGNLPEVLLETGVGDMRIEVKAPDRKERTEVVRQLVPSVDRPEELTEAMQSFLPIDIANVLRNAELQCSLDPHNALSSHISTVLRTFIPQSLQSLPAVSSTLHWDDIGGLESAQELLMETIYLPLKYSALFQSYPLKLRSGILLYGPPGCGKTLLGLTVAEKCKLNLVSVKGPELLNKYIGASEAAVRGVFQKAKAARPAVVFFDEFEAIAPKRGSGSNTGVTDRIVNQFLCELDGVESRTDVFVVAASSRPELIDAALLRPGRLDKMVFCGFPDAHARKDIVTKMNAKAKFDLDAEEIAGRTEGFTGADLQGLFTNLSIMHAHTAAEVTTATALSELATFRPTFSPQQITDFTRRYLSFQSRKSESTGTKVALY